MDDVVECRQKCSYEYEDSNIKVAMKGINQEGCWSNHGELMNAVRMIVNCVDGWQTFNLQITVKPN